MTRPLSGALATRFTLLAFLTGGVGCGGHAASIDGGTRADARGDAALVPDAADGAPALEASSEAPALIDAPLDAAASANMDVNADVLEGDAADGGTDAGLETPDAPDAAVVCGFVMPNPVSTGLPHMTVYDTSVSGIVSDALTGLSWQRKTDATTFQLAQAGPHCQALTLGGFSDWRLPDVVELVSILDLTEPRGFDAAVFADEPVDPYWTSARVPTGVGWTVTFGSQTATTFVVSPGDLLRVRCVRTGQSPAPRCASPAARYQSQADGLAQADGLVVDALTGLTWQRDGADTPALSWAAANAHCLGLPGGFRLPSLRELHTIVDYNVVMPALDPTDQLVFPNLPLSSEGPIQPNVTKSYFWTSSVVRGGMGTGWVVDFWVGQTFAPALTSLQNVRCVR